MSLLRPRVRDDRGRRVEVTGKPEHGLPVMALPGGVLVVVGVLLRDEPGAGLAAIVFGLPFFAVGVLFLYGLVFTRRFVRIWLRTGQCPSCDYALRDLPREPDGCTLCPECGAAWKLEEGTAARSHEGTEGGGE